MLLSEQRVSKKIIVPSLNIIHLYHLGDECNFITGGWVEGYSYSADGTGITRIKEATYLYQKAVGNTVMGDAAVTVIYVTNAPVDLTDISTLNFDIEFSQNGSTGQGSLRCGVGLNKMDNSLTTYTVVNITTSRKILTLDVNSLSGNYYIKLYCDSAGSPITAISKTYRVWGGIKC